MRFFKPLAALLAATMLVSADKPDPQAGVGYLPTDLDERGLWMQVNEYERDLKHSTFVMRDPDLNKYVREVFCRTVGEAECKDVRIYLMRTPYFNATMAPTGLMQVFSGLLLRTQNEAQLAAILGHEFTHYKNRHSIQSFRDIKKKLNALNFLVFLDGGLLTGPALLGGFAANSREMEAEADSGSIPMLVKAGYDPHSASLIWSQLRDEMDATALARKKKSRKDKDRGMFATHPPTAERMTSLKAQAEKAMPSTATDNRRAAYIAALAPYWAGFVDDQIKLNDFGGTEFLLASLANEGWTPQLLYARGELYRTRGRPEDLIKAVEFYRGAVGQPGTPLEAERGLGLALLRSGASEEGKAVLKSYLAKRPDAPDKAMINMLSGG
jgi:beta-barrel assembly-enhancing protease